jgi:hypothetical protein
MTDEPTILVNQESPRSTDPKTGWNIQLASQMVQSILIAHETNSDSWSVHAWEDQPLLAIGQINVISIGPSTPFGYMVDTDGLPSDLQTQVARYRGARSYSGLPWAAYLHIPADHVDDVAPLLETAHLTAIRRLAGSVRTKSQRANFHRQDFVDELERITGQTLPTPNYWLEQPRSASSSSRRYWKISPGSYASKWEEFKNRSVAAVHWSDEPVDLSLLPPEKEAFKREVRDKLGIGSGAAHSLWTFVHEMREGDRVLAYGNKTVLGTGTILGPYHFGDDDFSYAHRHAVRWDVFHERPIHTLRSQLQSKLMSNATIVALTEEEFHLATAQPQDVTYNPQVVLAPRTVVQQAMATIGLTYTNAQIATFYTALQTKGFVVLSGISGTGKSKIAQGFVRMLPAPPPGTILQPPPRNVLSFVTNPDQNWAAVSSSQAELFPPVPVDYKHSVVYEFNSASYTGFAVTKVLAFGKPTLYLTLGNELVDKLRESDPQQTVYATTTMARSGDKIESVRLAFDPHELVGDTAPVVTTEASNSLFLSVRPDWRDSTSLLGYYNPLTETYEWTEFLRFLLRAADDYREHKEGALAWFVILDEMNLAHVEYYFADLLSIIESGRDEHGWSREPIRLTYPDAKTDNPPPHEILLPPNLYIIGTVNMDETTHAFSPKVLDRAFTIELTDVDFSAYPPEPSGSIGDMSEEERQSLLRAFTNGGTFAQISKDDIRQAVMDHPEIRAWLQNLNASLAEHQFHFGYRVFDEIAQFIYHADRNGMFDSWEIAFDHAVYMKVLPKFNGSHARLDGPLSALIEWAQNPAGAGNPSPETVGPDDGEVRPGPEALAPKLTRVLTRARRMKELLEANGFVSFG